MKKNSFIHEFDGYDGSKADCRIEVFDSISNSTVVIATQLPIKSGTRVSEFSEHLATQIYKKLFSTDGAHVKDFVYIEHTSADEFDDNFEFHRVDFTWDANGKQFLDPERVNMSKAEVEALVEESL